MCREEMGGLYTGYIFDRNSTLSYSWFARDVMTAMLVVNNKSISLLCEVNSIFMKILNELNFIVLTPNIAALSRGCKPRIPSTDKWYHLHIHTIVENFASLLTAINTLSLNY